MAAIRGERLVFADLSFALAPGGGLLLVGPKGSGKSTCFGILAGLGRVAWGRGLWDGQDALADKVAHAGRVAYLGHQDAVKPGLTARENFFRPDQADAGLAALGLTQFADLPARMLSAGQRRRLGLGRLAVGGAAVWLLDEPTLGLDQASVERLGGLLARHRAGGGMVVAATHLPLPLPDAEELALA